MYPGRNPKQVALFSALVQLTDVSRSARTDVSQAPEWAEASSEFAMQEQKNSEPVRFINHFRLLTVSC